MEASMFWVTVEARNLPLARDSRRVEMVGPSGIKLEVILARD